MKTDPRAVEVEIAALINLDLFALRSRWQQLFGNPPPKSLRRAFLVKACAYQIQAKAFGGLSPATKRRLREIAEAARNGTLDSVVAAPHIKPGTQLLRVWQGQTHTITVLADGFCLERAPLRLPVGDRQGNHRHELERTYLLRPQANSDGEQECRWTAESAEWLTDPGRRRSAAPSTRARAARRPRAGVQLPPRPAGSLRRLHCQPEA